MRSLHVVLRYTLTEGDFHHLKNARLTNLHIPAPALKIVTIHECDSAENTITVTTRPAAKSALSIFQVRNLIPLMENRRVQRPAHGPNAARDLNLNLRFLTFCLTAIENNPQTRVSLLPCSRCCAPCPKRL